jgi:hypothetical protein
MERKRGRRTVIWTEVVDLPKGGTGIWCTLDCGHHTMVRRQRLEQVIASNKLMPPRIPERLNCPLCDNPALKEQPTRGDRTVSNPDPRFDRIILTMQRNIGAGKTPTEVFVHALADAYALGAEDGQRERDELRALIDGLKREIATDEALLTERDRLLAAIPECEAHGPCVPHAIEWIQQVKEQLADLTWIVGEFQKKQHEWNKERDELRSQMREWKAQAAFLADAITPIVQDADMQETHRQLWRRCKIALKSTPEQAVRYVQGLEDALRDMLAGKTYLDYGGPGLLCSYCRGHGETPDTFTHEPDCTILKAEQALAAHERPQSEERD